MIKKIRTTKLKIGMYVHDLDCNWMRHPFAVNQFTISTEKQIKQIKQAQIRELYIDTDKGLDVGSPTPVAAKSKPAEDNKPPASTNRTEEAPTIPLAEELPRANKIKKEATQMISNIMDDARAGKLNKVEHISPIAESMVSSVIRNNEALLGLTRIRKTDKYTFEHSVSVSILLIAFGESLAFDEKDLVQMGIGGLLMDIGKSLTPPQILNKPGKLTDGEFDIMREHVEYGQQILDKMPDVSEIAQNIATEHHERLDGSGYPKKKTADEISFYGQMAAIVDVYDALTVSRAYRKRISPNAALKKLMASGGQFNQELVQQFVHCVGIYPTGSLVSLSNGCFAVILESNKEELLLPKIRIIFDSTKRQFISHRDIDLSNQHEKERLKIIGAVEPEKWHIKPEDFMEHSRH